MEVTQSPLLDMSVDDAADIIDESHFLDTPIASENDQLGESAPTNNATIKGQSSKNGLLIKFQNTVSAMCCESDELRAKAHEQLFSAPARKGFAK